MTCVRRPLYRRRLTFISQRQKETGKARLRNKRPREDAGRSIPPHWLDTYVFSGSNLKSFSVEVAAGLSNGAFAALRRRARTEVIEQMQPDTSSENALEAQQRPEPRLHSERGVLN